MNLRELLEKATGGRWVAEGSMVAAFIKGRRPNGEVIFWCRPSIPDLLTPEQNEANAALIVALHNCADELLRVAELAEKRPNKMGPHYMIWMDSMDAALAALREKEGT